MSSIFLSKNMNDIGKDKVTRTTTIEMMKGG